MGLMYVHRALCNHQVQAVTWPTERHWWVGTNGEHRLSHKGGLRCTLIKKSVGSRGVQR